MTGVRLLLTLPQLSLRDCGDCLKHLYDEETGKRVERIEGVPTKRHAACPPPCQTPEGCPKGTPEKPKTLSNQNWLAYIHNRRCKAVGRFPDDPIVARNAAIIEFEHDRADRERQDSHAELMLQIGAGTRGTR